MRFRLLLITLVQLALAAPARAGEPDTARADAAAALADAMAQKDAGNNGTAIESLERAVALDPELTQAWVELGNLQLGAGRMPRAIEAYRAALALSPNLQNVRYNLAYSLRQVGRNAEAATAYRAYLKGSPTDPDALYGLAESLKGAERWSEAADAFEAYATAETRPDQTKWAEQARVEAATLRQRASAADPAAPMVKPAASEGASIASADPTTNLSAELAVPADARAMDRAMGVGQNRSPAFRRGINLLRTNDFAKALPELVAAAAEAPTDAVVLAALAGAHLGLRQSEAAIASYQRALAAGPSPEMAASIQFGIAEAMRSAGDTERARAALRQVIGDAATPTPYRRLAEVRLAALDGASRK